MNARTTGAPFFFALLVLAATFVAWRILTLGLADQWSVSLPDRALFWRPHDPDALREEAEDQFLTGNFNRAVVLGQRGVRAYPLDGRNYRIIASAADVRGDTRLALQLFRIAAIRAPRDLRTHTMLAGYALKAGNVDQALHELDLILRVQPEIQPDLLPKMARLAMFSDTEPAFVRILSRHPPWRTPFLLALAKQGPDLDAVGRVFRGLQPVGSTAQLSMVETGYFVDRQIRDRDWTSAYVTWVSSLPVAQRDALGNVFDGNFVMPFSGNGFGWRVTNSVDADIHVAALPNGGGNALVIDFQDTRMAFHNVTQLLALGPGRYVWRERAQADHLDTPRGLQWVLSCAEGRHQVLAESQLLVGSQTWREFEVPFEIASSGCGGQWLRLQMGAPDRINGRAAYAGLNVERAPTAAP